MHQRLVIEGYKLLKMWIGNNPISIMNNKIGDYSNIGINPWEQGFLTTGDGAKMLKMWFIIIH